MSTPFYFLRRQGERVRVTNPYLRFSSVMFRDFLAVERLRSEEDVEVAFAVGDMLGDDFVASPVMARFFATAQGKKGRFNPRMLPVLFESVASDATSDPLHLGLEENLEATDDDSHKDFPILDLTISAGHRTLGVFTADWFGDQAIEVGRQLSRVLIDVPTVDVMAPASVSDLVLGGDVDVVCGRLVIDVEDVRVQSDSVNPTRLRAKDFDSRTLRIFINDSSSLRLVVPQAHHPWHEYIWQGGGETSGVGVAAYDAALRFRQIYRWFSRSSMAGRFTYPAEAMDTILRKGRADYSCFTYLLSQDFVERLDSMYRLHEPIPAMVVLAIKVEDPAYRRFLERFVRWEEDAQ
jgi:hypothetical protein